MATVDLENWKRLTQKDRQQQPMEIRIEAVELWLEDMENRLFDAEGSIESLEENQE